MKEYSYVTWPFLEDSSAGFQPAAQEDEPCPLFGSSGNRDYLEYEVAA